MYIIVYIFREKQYIYITYEINHCEKVFRFWMARLINDSSRQCFSLPGVETNK